MVRVLLCHHFKAERVFSDSYQPTTLWTTKEFLFLATGAMTICVYSLDQPNFPLLCQFTTISNAAKLSCNAWANYVATVERDRPRGRRSDGRSHQTFARVYFNWQKASAGEAVRAVFAGHSKRNSETAATSHFLAVQLPLAFLPAGISSCPSTGNILVAGHKRLCLFRFCGRAAGDELNTSRSVLCRDFELIVDIDPGFSCIRGIALSDSFVAVRSYLEVRVIKLIFSSLDEAAQPKGSFVWEGDGRGSSSVTRILSHSSDAQYEVIDENCIQWDFEDFQEANIATVKQDQASRKNNLGTDVTFPMMRREKGYRDTSTDPREVLGPKQNMVGLPMRVSLAGLYGVGIAVDGQLLEVQGVTMLYRRFAAEKLGSEDMDSASLHSLQLLPTYTRGLQIAQVERRSPLLQNTEWADITLCGMCCLVSGPKEGYMYDVLTHTKLLSCYEFTCDTLSVSACHSLLHAITRQGLETYTARTYSSASEWVRAQLQRVNDQGGRKQRKRKQKVDAESKVGREHSFGGEKEDVSRNTIPSEHTPKSPGTNSEAATVEKSKEEGRMSVGRGSLLHRADGTKVMNESSPLGETTNQGTDTEKASKKTVSLTEGGEDDLRTHSAEAVGAAGQKVVGQDAVGPSGSEVDLPAAHSTSPDPAARKPPPSGEREQSVGTSPEEKSPGQDDFPLPVYDVEWLRQLCPPADLDICLIGMYPFPGPLFVTATEETVTLFTRASAEALQGNKTSPHKSSDGQAREWSVYILLNMDPTQLYKAVMPLANRCQKHNPPAYHHLVCEQHLFLRTLCLVDHETKDSKSAKKLRKLLFESAANLADVYARSCEGASDSAEYYEMTGWPLRDVVDRTWKFAALVGEGVVHYLDAKLFGTDESVMVTEATAKRIFKIYSKVRPSRVSELVLMSSLNGFAPEIALGALEDLKKTAASGNPDSYSLSALDNLVCAVLYIHECDPEQAEASLAAVPKEKLVDAVRAHSYLLHEDGEHFTPLAQLLRKHHPGVFLDVLLHLHDGRQMSLDTILHLLGVDKSSAYQSDHVLEFLEPVLNDRQRQKSFEKAVVHLSDIYVQRLLDPKHAPQSVSPTPHSHIPKGDGHFDRRFSWLDTLSPFKGSIPDPGECCLAPGPSQIASASPLVRSRRLGRTSSPVPPSARGDPAQCCCCCQQTLLKLQSLLSSELANAHLCTRILDAIEGRVFPGDAAVQLLCLPRVGMSREAINLAMAEFPSIVLDYGKDFFRKDVEKWSFLLESLLEKLRGESPDDHESMKTRKGLLSLLKDVLSHLTLITSPLELLSLLPTDGALSFFLPFLEQSYLHSASQNVTQQLASTGQ